MVNGNINLENVVIGDAVDNAVIDYINGLDLFEIASLLGWLRIREHCCGSEVQEQKKNLINVWHTGTTEQRTKLYKQYLKRL